MTCVIVISVACHSQFLHGIWNRWERYSRSASICMHAIIYIFFLVCFSLAPKSIKPFNQQIFVIENENVEWQLRCGKAPASSSHYTRKYENIVYIVNKRCTNSCYIYCTVESIWNYFPAFGNTCSAPIQNWHKTINEKKEWKERERERMSATVWENEEEHNPVEANSKCFVANGKHINNSFRSSFSLSLTLSSSTRQPIDCVIDGAPAHDNLSTIKEFNTELNEKKKNENREQTITKKKKKSPHQN